MNTAQFDTLITHPDRDVRLRAAMDAGTLREPHVTAILVSRVAVEEDFHVREYLIWALVQHGQDAVPAVLALLTSDKAIERRQAAHVLSKIGDPSYVPHLLPVVADEDRDVAVKAYRAAASTGSVDVVPALVSRLGDGDVEQRDALSNAMQQLGDLGVGALTSALQDGDAGVRQHAAEALAQIGEDAQSATSALSRLVADEDVDVALAAVMALGSVGGHDALAALAQVSEQGPRPLVGVTDQPQRFRGPGPDAGTLRTQFGHQRGDGDRADLPEGGHHGIVSVVAAPAQGLDEGPHGNGTAEPSQHLCHLARHDRVVKQQRCQEVSHGGVAHFAEGMSRLAPHSGVRVEQQRDQRVPCRRAVTSDGPCQHLADSRFRILHQLAHEGLEREVRGGVESCPKANLGCGMAQPLALCHGGHHFLPARGRRLAQSPKGAEHDLLVQQALLDGCDVLLQHLTGVKIVGIQGGGHLAEPQPQGLQVLNVQETLQVCGGIEPVVGG